MTLSRVSALALAASLGLAAAAHAQTPPPPPPAGPGAPGAHHWDPEAMKEHRERHQAARLKALHDALNIRPDQDAAFQAFAASMRPPRPEGGPDRREPGAGWKGHAPGAAEVASTAPERADLMLKRFDERAARMREQFQRRADAVKSFYAVLTPDQKRTFDSLPMLEGRGGEGREGWRGPRGPMGDGKGPGGPQGE